MALSLRLRSCSLVAGKNASILKFPLSLQGSRGVITTSSVSAMKVQTAEDYWAKNERLKRPTSPHLTIYKPQITSMLSISHRGTGLWLSAVISGFSMGMLVLPNSFPYYLNVLENLHFGGGLIFLAKFSLAFPMMFHTCNGIRHLVWDMGYGFTLRALYKSGWLVVGISTVLGAILAAL